VLYRTRRLASGHGRPHERRQLECKLRRLPDGAGNDFPRVFGVSPVILADIELKPGAAPKPSLWRFDFPDLSVSGHRLGVAWFAGSD